MLRARAMPGTSASNMLYYTHGYQTSGVLAGRKPGDYI